MARNKTHRDAKRKAKWRVKRVLWQIYLDPVTHMLLATEERPKESPRVGKIHVERWALEGRARGLHTRVQHAVRCLQRFTLLVTRPRERACQEAATRKKTVREARQRLISD